jgi:hypothetical protein
MIEFKYKINGVRGHLHVTDADVNQRLTTHHEYANTNYLIDELALMVVPDNKQVLSFHLQASTGTACCPRKLAELNGLSEIHILIDRRYFKRLI